MVGGVTSSEISGIIDSSGLYKKLNVCISNNLDFVAIQYSIHVLHLGGASFLLLLLLQIVGDQVENDLPYAWILGHLIQLHFVFWEYHI